jgi:cyclohexanone monooxygenase
MSDTTGIGQGSSSGFDPVELRQKYREERDKRLRRDGNAQYLDVSGAYEDFASDPYLESSPGGQPREPRIADVDTVVLGGGWSGLQTAARSAVAFPRPEMSKNHSRTEKQRGDVDIAER